MSDLEVLAQSGVIEHFSWEDSPLANSSQIDFPLLIYPTFFTSFLNSLRQFSVTHIVMDMFSTGV